MLGACSGPTYWRNDSPRNWGADLYDCTRESSTTITAGGGTGLVGAVNAAEVGSVRTDYAMRDLCLQARGWYQVAAPTSTPGMNQPSSPSPAPPPSSLPPMVLVTSAQIGWVSVARKGQEFVWTGVWGEDAGARSDCEDRRGRAKASNPQWSYDECRRISVWFQKASGAPSGPGWAIVGTKTFIGGPTEQACTQQRAKVMAANPAVTYEPCRQLWFSSGDWSALR